MRVLVDDDQDALDTGGCAESEEPGKEDEVLSLAVDVDVVAWDVGALGDADEEGVALFCSSGALEVRLELPAPADLALVAAIEAALCHADLAPADWTPTPAEGSAVGLHLRLGAPNFEALAPGGRQAIPAPYWMLLIASEEGDWHAVLRLRHADVGALLHQLRTWQLARRMLADPALDEGPRDAIRALLHEYERLDDVQASKFLAAVATGVPGAADDLASRWDLLTAATEDPAA